MYTTYKTAIIHTYLDNLRSSSLPLTPPRAI